MMANAFALAASVVVTLFTLPILVSGLGPVRYGIWVVTGTLVSYFGLLDLGLRAAVTTYVARDHAVGNHHGASATVSAGLFTRQWMGLAAVVVSLLIATVLARLLQIPPDLVWEARQALVACTVALAVSLIGGVFAAVLQAMNRQDVVATATITQTLIRAIGTVVLMRNGYSIMALAVLQVVAELIANALIVQRCFRLYPQLRLSFSAPSREMLVGLGGFSGEMALWQLFSLIITAGPPLVIGAMLSPAAVTLYVLGGYLVAVVEQIRLAITLVFTPLASRYDAAGNRIALRDLLRRGTRLVLIVVLPILVGLLARGETFLRVWTGPEYSGPAGEVLRVLSVSMVFASAMAPGGAIILGLGRQREALVWLAVQAAATLSLAVVLARSMGIVGVAWAGAAPTLFGIAFTCVACRLVRVSLVRHVVGDWGRPVVAVVPFAVACFVTDHYWEATSMPGFFVQMAAVFPVYVLSCVAFLGSDLKRGWVMLYGPRVDEDRPR